MATQKMVTETAAASTYATYGRLLAQARVDRAGQAKLIAAQAKARRAATAGDPVPASTATLTVNGQRTIIRLPATFDRNTPLPAVIHLQGFGNTADLSGQFAAMATAALNAGFVFITSDFHGNQYGGPNVQADLKAILDAALDYIPINGVVLSGESMGGIGVLNALSHATLPNVVGAFLAQPIVSLKHRYDVNPSPQHDAIVGAYGIAIDGSDYAAKTDGWDPNLLPGGAFAGVPLYITGSPTDTSALVSPFMDDLRTRLTGLSPVTWKQSSGSHGDPSMFIPADYTAFLTSVAAGLLPPAPKYNFTTDAQMLAHFNAATLALANGAAVDSWAPASGTYTAPLVQATAANQPTFIAADATLANKAAVHMTDSVRRMSTAAWGAARATPVTIVAVTALDSAPAGAPMWTGQNGVYLNGSTNAGLVTMGAGAVHQMSRSVATGMGWKIIVAVYNGATSKLFVSGKAGTAGTTSTTTENANAALPGLRLNTSSDGTGTSAERKFARFAAIGRALTDQEVADTMDRLSQEYGIALT
jgi:hypothetical protein